MKKREKNAQEIEEELFQRYPALEGQRTGLERAYEALKFSYRDGGKLLVAGNGGSASDSEHIVGELMKSFLFNRNVDKEFSAKMKELYGEEGRSVTEKLEGALPAVSLPSFTALGTAFANDVDAAVSFAQMVYGYGRPQDIFLGISTSGNSRNIIYALMAANAKGLHTIALVGGTGGKCAQLADTVICVPEEETFKIQEQHLPVYHALCAMLEADFFTEKKVD